MDAPHLTTLSLCPPGPPACDEAESPMASPTCSPTPQMQLPAEPISPDPSPPPQDPHVWQPRASTRLRPVFFCDLCGVGCAGAQTYREHLDGQRHRKKEVLATLGDQLTCDLCHVACTGPRALAAHIRGARHQRALRRYSDLEEPPAELRSLGGRGQQGPPDSPADHGPSRQTAEGPRVQAPRNEAGEASGSDSAPLGLEFVEEVRDGRGRVLRLRCSLCACSFNDRHARDLHLRGRRHRLQYREKVDPELPLSGAPSARTCRRLDEQLRRQRRQKRRRLEALRHLHSQARIQDVLRSREQEPGDPGRAPPSTSSEDPAAACSWPPRPPPQQPPRRWESREDRHALSRHAAIYPAEAELRAVQSAVEHTERALRRVSDQLALDSGCDSSDGDVAASLRVLKGVMRVGTLAKGLLRPGAQQVQLLLLCSQKPTRSLLRTVAELLPQELPAVTEAEYRVSQDAEAAITVASCEEPHVQVTVSLTSPLMREDPSTPPGSRAACSDPEDILNPDKCLQDLKALRQAKWFQARASGLQPCVVVIRLFKDLCLRTAPWAPLPAWALELLVEKALSSAARPLGPGDAIRRVLECVAAGTLLPDGPGLQDPCERELTDALGPMTAQEREELTASAQHALRLVAFRQIHRVLGMEPLQPPRSRLGARMRKRLREAGTQASDPGPVASKQARPGGEGEP